MQVTVTFNQINIQNEGKCEIRIYYYLGKSKIIFVHFMGTFTVF